MQTHTACVTAIALAGHLKLDNLVLLYDNNQVTCDGPLEWISSEDTNSKMRASGWEVIDVMDGSYDVQAIVSALNLVKSSKGRPVFINIRTVIGVDTAFAGTAKAHHGAFDEESIAELKALAGLPLNSTHLVPTKALQFFRERVGNGSRLQQEWDVQLAHFRAISPVKAAEFAARCAGEIGDVERLLEEIDSTRFKGLATREVNGILLEELWKVCPSLCGGGADLVNSNKIRYTETDVFHPSVASNS